MHALKHNCLICQQFQGYLTLLFQKEFLASHFDPALMQASNVQEQVPDNYEPLR